MPESLERARTFVRRLAILKFLDTARTGVRPDDLLAEVCASLGCEFSSKTMGRDIEALKQAGFDIRLEKISSINPQKVYVLKKTDYIKVLRPHEHQSLNISETLALAVAARLLYPLAGTPLWEGIESFMRKLREALPAGVLRYLDKQQPLWYVQGPARKDYSQKHGILSALNRAIFEHRVVEVLYQSLRDEEPVTRFIHPYGMVIESNSLFVIAVNEAREPDKFRPYKLERFTRVKVLDRRYQPRDDYDADEFFRISRGVFQSDDVETFRIRYDKSVARWALETPFHTQRVVERAEDGSVIIEVQGYVQEMIPRILGMGTSAEILSPETARQRVRGILDGLTTIYR
jgi:predicted DNA-binding transcriptional regulator YafY